MSELFTKCFRSLVSYQKQIKILVAGALQIECFYFFAILKKEEEKRTAEQKRYISFRFREWRLQFARVFVCVYVD